MKCTCGAIPAKVGRGIGLRPALWKRIDAFAAAQGMTRSEVIEQILEPHIPQDQDSQELREDTQEVPAVA